MTTEDFTKYKQAQDKAKAKSQELVDYLREVGPKNNRFWKPEALQNDIMKVFLESELRNAINDKGIRA